MFLLYVNDLPNLKLYANVLIYPDDVVLYHSGPDIAILLEELKYDLGLLLNWSNHNGLTINFSKTQYMVFSNRSKLRNARLPESLNLNGDIEIQRTNKYCYLGINLDPELQLEEVAKDAMQKASHKIYNLSKIRNSISTNTATILYKTISYIKQFYPRNKEN